jgi:hypothetical protein
MRGVAGIYTALNEGILAGVYTAIGSLKEGILAGRQYGGAPTGSFFKLIVM